MKRDLVEINRKAPQWAHKAVWNKWYMEPKAGFTLNRMWADSEPDITEKTSRSNEVRDSDLRRVASAVATLPTSEMPDSAFLNALGTPGVQTIPSQQGFFRPTPYGFRQVVQHVSKHVAYETNC